MNIDWKSTSRLTFGAVLLCALLPFASVTCQGKRLVSLTGVQLASGTTLQEPDPFGSGSGKVHRVEPEPLLIAVYLSALVGLLISFAGRNGEPRAGAWLAVLGVVCLHLVRARIEGLAGLTVTGLSIEYEAGFWIPMLLFPLTAVLGVREGSRGVQASHSPVT